MFTLDQINEIHTRLGKQGSLPDYLSALHQIGVDKYDSFVTDGHSEYHGKNDHKIVSPPEHEKFPIARTCNREAFMSHLNLHEQGRTSYTEMSQGLADSGIEKWTFDTAKKTMTYYDLDGNEVLSEKIG